MNELPTTKKAEIVAMLADGCSIRAVERIAGPEPMSRAAVGGSVLAYNAGRPTLRVIRGGMDRTGS